METAPTGDVHGVPPASGGRLPPAANKADSSLKTKEEYCVALHDKLLDARKDATDFVNLYITSSYGLVALILLNVGGYVTKVSVGGAEFDLTKGYMLEYGAGLVLLAYVLISFHLRRLARVFRAIRLNGSEILKINPAAKIIGIEDMKFYVEGLCGVVLAFARMQTRVIIDNLQSIYVPLKTILETTGILVSQEY